MSVEKLRSEHNVVTHWIHYPLHPETPDEGRSVAELYGNRPEADRRAMAAHMRGLMEEAGLPYGKRSMTYNSRLAQELGTWADTQDGGDAVHDLLFRRYFVDNANIADPEVLVGVAEEAGLSGSEARRILEHRLFSPQVNEDWQRAWENGVTGVPTFTARDLYVVGCQPLEVLLRFVNHLRELQAADPQ